MKRNFTHNINNKKSTTCTVATGIQCVFTFYSVILFISLHNNSPLKCMCIILPAHPNAMQRGDGHFLNCLVVFFFRSFVRHGLLFCWAKCLCVRARAFFCSCSCRDTSFISVDDYHIDERNGKFEKDFWSSTIACRMSDNSRVYNTNHKTDTANVLTAFCHMCQCSHCDELCVCVCLSFHNVFVDGRTSIDCGKSFRKSLSNRSEWVEMCNVRSREISCELNCSTLYSVISVK